MSGVTQQGKLNHTKEALKTVIRTAIPEAEVSGTWKPTIGHLIRNLPFINVRIAPVRIEDIVYDRNIGGEVTGSEANYFFMLHIFHSNCNEAGEEKCKFAQDIATRITDYLIPQPATLGFDIDGLNTRESEPDPKMGRVSRVIVEGQLHILRID